MDPEMQQHVFEPFFTTKGPGRGTGLGLATVYGVVKQSGGVIGIDSEPGQGSTFKIFLPQAHETEVESAPDIIDTKSSTGIGTILLVEDEEALLNLTADLLGDNGYIVLAARDGIAGARDRAIIQRTYSPSIDRCHDAEAGRTRFSTKNISAAPGHTHLVYDGSRGARPSFPINLTSGRRVSPKTVQPGYLASPYSPGFGYGPGANV